MTADLRPTPARVALMRAVDAGTVTESRDGALHRHIRDGNRVVRRDAIGALEDAGLVQLSSGRRSWTHGPYNGIAYELTAAGRAWLDIHGGAA